MGELVMAITRFSDEEHAQRYIRQLEKGEEVLYHLGYLAADREIQKTIGPVADAIYVLAREGVVELFQKQQPLPPNASSSARRNYAYYARKR